MKNHIIEKIGAIKIETTIDHAIYQLSYYSNKPLPISYFDNGDFGYYPNNETVGAIFDHRILSYKRTMIKKDQFISTIIVKYLRNV